MSAQILLYVELNKNLSWILVGVVLPLGLHTCKYSRLFLQHHSKIQTATRCCFSVIIFL